MKTDPTVMCYKQIGVQGDGTCPALETYIHCRNCSVFEVAGRQLLEGEPLAEYVDEQTRQLTIPESIDASDIQAFSVFRLGEEWLALDVGVMVEVTPPRGIHRVPHRSNQRFLGLVNIRGELQLCLSLGDLLGIQSHFNPLEQGELSGDGAMGQKAARGNGSNASLLVTEHAAVRWVFPVDEVAGIYRVSADQLSGVPSTVANSPSSFSKAVFAWQYGNKKVKVGVVDECRLFESLQGSIQ